MQGYWSGYIWLRQIKGGRVRSGQIALIPDDDCGAAFDRCQQCAFFVVKRLSRIEDHENERGVGERFPAAGDAKLFDFFEGFAQAGGIDELEGNTVKRDALGDEIARSAGRRGDDGAIAFDEAVEERAFACIGTADDGQGQTIMHDTPTGVGCVKRGKRRREFADAASDFGLRGHVNVIFCEVDAGFEEGDEFDEGLLHGLYAAAECAAHLACGLAGLGQGLGFDEIAHSFGLREVELAGEKRALRELAGFGEARTEVESAAKQQVQNDRGAVGSNFDEIVGGVGIRRGKKRDDGFVYLVGASVVRDLVVKNIGKTCAGVLEGMMQADEIVCDGCGLRTAEAHDADATAAGRRGDGDDGFGGQGRGERRIRVLYIHALYSL